MEIDLKRRWAEFAACTPEDDKLFFAGGSGHTKASLTVQAAWDAAKQICRNCPVLLECGSATLGESQGVWGGMDPWDRALARRRLTREIERWPLERRLAVGEVMCRLRLRGLKWIEVQAESGIPEGSAQKLAEQWERHQESLKATVIELPLPEPSHRSDLPFPKGHGERHLWARHNGMITDCWYRAQTPDGAWIYVETWAGHGRAVKKWVRATDVRIYNPQPVVHRNYAKRPDAA